VSVFFTGTPVTRAADAPGERRSAFAEPRFARYFSSSLFSTLGSWVVRFLVGWSAWALTGSAFWVGVVAGLMLAPTFLLSPLFGILAERINPRNGIIATLAAHALIALAAGAAEALALLTLPTLLVLATTLGAATAAHTPIRLALVPRLVGRNALPSAIGISAMTFNTARILGPAAGAWLIAHFSVGTAYLVAALLFAAALPVLASLRDVGAPPPRAHGSFARQLREGVAYARHHPGIRLIFAFTLLNGLLGRTVIELLPALNGQLLSGDSTTLATLTASAGAGSIAGGLAVSRQSGRETRLLGLVAIALGCGGLALAMATLLEGLTAFCGLIALVSLITTIAGTGSQALAQLTVDEAFRGRVLSLWTVLAMGAPALGGLLMGVAADRLGFPVVLTVFGFTGAIVALLLFRRRGRLLGD
jgi:MFS family permease